jgi:aspartate-semialdehyde dehydrogenase
MDTLYNVLVIGGTGLVGRQLLELLIVNKFPYKNIKATHSNNNLNKIQVNGEEIDILPLNENVFKDIDICFFCSTSEISSRWGKYAHSICKYVIDNSSCFRMDKDVSLIVPEINFDKCESTYVCNPNCSTIQSVLVLDQIRKRYKINKVIYSTYQSCSGGGKEELKELNQSYDKICNIYSQYLCDTCISQIGEITSNGFSLEELKMINETKKILDDYKLEVHASCIRVPVSYCHGVFIYVEVDENVNVDNIIQLIKESNRLVYKPDNEILYFQEAYRNDKVLVGRVKKDLVNNKAFSIFCVADNLRVGAAYNAYNIALNLIRRDNEKH